VPPVTQPDREAAVKTPQHAAGDGRLPLNEFSHRAGTALTAETQDQLEAAAAGLEAAPPVGSTRTVSSIITFFGHRRQAGRWRGCRWILPVPRERTEVLRAQEHIHRGQRGSNAHYTGAFSADGGTLTGAWVWPGSGYQTTSTRQRHARQLTTTEGRA
jgi:DUF1707 SHOCT-like domain